MGRVVRRVHIFGPSTLFAEDLGPGMTLLDLTRRALAADRPEIDWDCRASVAYLAPGLPGRVMAEVEPDPQDVVVLRFPQNQFMSDYVVYRIREHSRLLYRATVTVSRWVNRLAGGGPLGKESVRGWLFRAPRWLVERVVGVAPAIRVEDAIDMAIETIDSLLRHEDVRVAYIMSGNTVVPNIGAAEAARRRTLYVSTVRDHCRRHRIPFLDPVELQEQIGLRRRTSSDGWHTDIANREHDARVLSQTIIQTVEGSTDLDFSSLTGAGTPA